MPEEFLSIEDAAKLLNLDYKTIYKFVRSGEIPAARIGRIYRIKRSDLDDFFERSKAAVQGVECSRCGESVHSALSIAARCEQCGAPLCMKCVKVEGLKRCREHAERPDEAGSEAAGKPGSDGL